MSITIAETVSAHEPAAVTVVARAGGWESDVWLRRDIASEEVESASSDGTTATRTQWTAREVHYVVDGVPDASAIAEVADAAWTALTGEAAS